MGKDNRVNVRLDPNLELEIKELCKHHNSSISAMIRVLVKRSLNELNKESIMKNKNILHSDRIASVIADNYDQLKEMYLKGSCKLQSVSYEDVFQETILYIIHDKKAFDMTNDELFDYFGYKYKSIKFRYIQDAKSELKHANNKQTEKKDE